MSKWTERLFDADGRPYLPRRCRCCYGGQNDFAQ